MIPVNVARSVNVIFPDTNVVPLARGSVAPSTKTLVDLVWMIGLVQSVAGSKSGPPGYVSVAVYSVNAALPRAVPGSANTATINPTATTSASVLLMQVSFLPAISLRCS